MTPQKIIPTPPKDMTLYHFHHITETFLTDTERMQLDFSKDKNIQNTISLYTFLLSGEVFYSAAAKSESPYLTALFSIAAGAPVLIITYILFRALNFSPHGIERRGAGEKVMGFTGLALCVCASSEYFAEFSKELPQISPSYSHPAFMLAFIFLTVILGLYIFSGGYSSYSRLCVIVLPFILITLLSMWLAFFADGIDVLTKHRPLHTGAVSGYIKCALFYFADTSFYFFAASDDSACAPDHEKRGSSISFKSVLYAYFLFSLTLILITAKYRSFFGGGISFAERPGHILLSLVPSTDIQDLFIIIYYTALVMKISVYCGCCRFFLKKVLPAGNGAFLTDGICAVVIYSVFLLAKSFKRYRLPGDAFFILPALCALMLSAVYIIIRAKEKKSHKIRKNSN